MDSERFANEAAEYAADTTRQWFYELYEKPARKCESEIERIMLAALVAVFSDINLTQFLPSAGGRTAERSSRMCAWVYHFPKFSSCTLHCQVLIGEYRVDFLLQMRGAESRAAGVVIECDGHDYHERTKEQAKRDRRRDRVLQAMGYRVMRFTGSEICRDPIACAIEVYETWQAFQSEQIRLSEPLLAKLDADFGDK